MPFWFSIKLQDANSFMMEYLIFFNDILMMLCLIIMFSIAIIYLMMNLMKNYYDFFFESQSLEDILLIIPIMLLLFMGFPSIKNLYMYEEFNESDMNIKITGFQWYWNYSFNNMDFMIDSFMKKENFNFNLLENNNNLIVPIKCIIRFLISSNDVIHSWTIPSMGIKMDAIPGHLSNIICMFNRPGIYIGQCSEICGANHSFMPIFVFSTNFINFL